MKAIMYHYVRPDSPEYPFFRHLHIDEFVKQLEYFGNEFGFLSQDEFARSLAIMEPQKGLILTFDDGLKDHFQYVLPELERRGLWGIFYITTSPYVTGKLIDVHSIHMLLGKFGGSVIAEVLQKLVADEYLSHSHIEEFRTLTYSRQKNSNDTVYVKRLLNYFIDYKFRQGIIDQLMLQFFPNETTLVEEFYMTRAELAGMSRKGMVLGSHTMNHPVLSKLSVSEQEEEIVSSYDLLEAIAGKQTLKTFCYPYGGFHTFTKATEEVLDRNDFAFSFNVESKDIEREELRSRRQALPRYDCNLFPYGSIRESSVEA